MPKVENTKHQMWQSHRATGTLTRWLSPDSKTKHFFPIPVVPALDIYPIGTKTYIHKKTGRRMLITIFPLGTLS